MAYAFLVSVLCASSGGAPPLLHLTASHLTMQYFRGIFGDYKLTADCSIVMDKGYKQVVSNTMIQSCIIVALQYPTMPGHRNHQAQEAFYTKIQQVDSGLKLAYYYRYL